MKHLLLFSVFLFLANTTFAQQNLSYNFDPIGHTSINVDIPHKSFVMKQAREQKFTIDVEIKVNQPKAVIDQLIRIGRYKVTQASKDGSFVLSAATTKQVVTVGGKTLTEEITIAANCPEGYSNNGNIIQKDGRSKTISEPIVVNINFVYPSSIDSAPSSIGTVDDSGTVEPTTAKEVQLMYGDIIMGGIALDDFDD